MDALEEVLTIGKKLEKMVSSGSLDTTQGEELLNVLGGLPVTLEVLSRSKIGVTVNNFRQNCKDDKIKCLAKDLIKKWKKRLPDKSPSLSKTSKHSKSSSSIVKEDDSQDSGSHRSESPHATTSKVPNFSFGNSLNLQASSTNDPTRLKSRELLSAALVSSEHEGVDFDLLAAAIEDHIFQEVQSTDVKYKNQIRSRVFNLRDRKNPELKRSVIEGIILPERIAVMTTEEMASEELKKERAQMTKQAINDHQLATQGGAKSDLFKCGRCGKRDTTYNQVQTRSADEPMTTFVLCNVCGKRWKFC